MTLAITSIHSPLAMTSRFCIDCFFRFDAKPQSQESGVDVSGEKDASRENRAVANRRDPATSHNPLSTNPVWNPPLKELNSGTWVNAGERRLNEIHLFASVNKVPRRHSESAEAPLGHYRLRLQETSRHFRPFYYLSRSGKCFNIYVRCVSLRQMHPT